MKKIHLGFAVSAIVTFLFAFVFIACNKEFSKNSSNQNYISLLDFYQKNKIALQTKSVNALSGGSFTTSQGTVVDIPANVFVDSTGQPPKGNVSIEFLDIYKKSDMLLSNVGTMTGYGAPLKSGGEFFIDAKSGNKTMFIAKGPINIQQPLNGLSVDPAMQAFVGVGGNDSVAVTWVPQQDSVAFDKVVADANSYIFSLYQFTDPAINGSWCNSDDANYFSAYPQTSLDIHGNYDTSFYAVDVFLVFKDITCMVHVYENYGSGNNDYIYDYAPVGLSATVVAIACKNGNLYSSFTPITISANQTVNFDLSKTTTDDFKTALKALD